MSGNTGERRGPLTPSPRTSTALNLSADYTVAAGAILKLVDGRRSIGEIGDALAANGIARDAFARDFAALAKALQSINRLLLAAP